MSGPNTHIGGSDRHPKTFDVFVGSLRPDRTEGWILEYFNQYGVVVSISLTAGGKDHEGTNICFVRFKERMDAVRAIESNMRVDWARISGASKGGNSWYNDYKSERGDKRGHEGHRATKSHKSQDKSDRGPPGHVHRQPGVVGDKKRDNSHKLGEVIREEAIMVTFHETPLVFWGQPVDRSAELLDLSGQLQVVCPGGQSLMGTPSMEKVYATVFSVDQNWYRCRVSKTLSEAQVEVTFIDFGNTEVKNNNDVKELLPNLAAIRPLAQRYCLYGLRLLHQDKNSIGFIQGCQKLVELTDNQTLIAHVYHGNTRGMIPVVLNSATTDINQEMLNSKFAETIKVKNLPAQPECHTSQSHAAQNPAAPTALSHIPPGHHHPPPLMAGVGHLVNTLNMGQWNPEAMESVTVNRDYSNDSGAMLLSALQPKPLTPKKRQNKLLNQNDIANNTNPHQVASGGDLHASTAGADNISQGAAEIAHYKHVANQAKREAQQMAVKLLATQEDATSDNAILKREWDMTTLELEQTKTNLRSLKDDYTALLKERTERSLPQRLARLVLSVEQVKSYRIQFPSEEQCEDPIEQAFNVANDHCKLVTSELPVSKTVQRAQSIYRTTMSAISRAENVEGLNDLIAARDQSRKDLCEALTEFIKTASQLPLSERSQQVEHMLGVMAKTYKDFFRTECPVMEDVSFEQAIATYREWKNQKMTEFAEARTRTNTCHNGVNNALRTLQQQLSLDSVGENGVTSFGSLDQLLDGLQEAVDEEARRTNLMSEVNLSDTAIVSNLLYAVDRELRRELVDIVHLRRLLAENASLLDNIEPWLTDKPDFQQITVTRKNIKSLKSKLRHKLADLQDLQEDYDETDNDEMRAISEELAAIRLQLHMAFLQEDQLLADLANLNVHHFPELSLLHADLNLHTVKQYNGLIKQGRALDQFDIQPMPCTKKTNIHKAVFYNKNYVIKEYIIDETVGVKKSEFLRRAYFYNQIINLHILPIEAIFFTGAGRQVFVQLPYYDMNLTQLLEEGPVSMECAYHILCKVLVGLQAVHSANLVFGAVHPNNILLQKDNLQSVVLAELDFSKSPYQRAGSFTTKSHLCFQPPEIQKDEITCASDMYNMGLLALWLHFPSYKFVLRANGVPDFSPLEMDRSLEQLLVSLLQDEPTSRRMADSTWQLPYFSNSPHSRPSSPQSSPEEQTLQLRPKADGRPSPKNGGILKNKDSSSPTSSPVLLSPQSPEKLLTQDALQTVTAELLPQESMKEDSDEELELATSTLQTTEALQTLTTELLPQELMKQDSDEELEHATLLTTEALQTITTKPMSPPLIKAEPIEEDSDEWEEPAETLDVNGAGREELIDRFMNIESTTSTPILISSPQGTPMNTPVERQSEGSSPPERRPQDESHQLEATTGLVKTAMLQCASLETTSCEPVDMNGDISDGAND